MQFLYTHHCPCGGVVEPIGAAFGAHDLDTREPQVAIDVPQFATPSGPSVPKARRVRLSAQEGWEMGRALEARPKKGD